MIVKIKILLICLTFISFPLAYSAETIFVPEKSLLFNAEKDNRNWTPKMIVQQSFIAEVIKKEKVFLPREKATGFFVDIYYLKNPDSDVVCFFPEVSFKRNKEGVFIPNVDQIDSLMFLGIFVFVLGLAALAGYLRLKSEKKKYLLPAALLCFFLGYAAWYIGVMSDATLIPSDDIFYFDIAKKMLALDFTSVKFRYTIGFPVFCIPFILLFHLQNWGDFVLVYMNLQTFILIPGLFLVLYRFFTARMGLSEIKSFSILLLWLILMVFYIPMYGSTNQAVQYEPEFYYSNACFYYVKPNIYFSFFQLTKLGRNAMSDYATVFLLIILLDAAMKKSRSLIRFFILSMGFGFICLCRINYIFFAPLLAFVFYDSFSELWNRKRNYLYALLCGTAGFMLIFFWQFILNKIQLGSPFLWPHSLHDFAPDRGFVWKVVPYGFRFLCQTNYVYIILGISSLLFIPDRKIRALLTLWIFPSFLFFCGYPIVFNNSIRFIFALFPPLTAAIVLNPIWKTPWSFRIKAASVVFSSCILCKSNIFFVHFQPWDFGRFGITHIDFMIIQGAVFLFCCAVIFSMRKDLKADYVNTIVHFRFLILFTAVFFLGSVCVYIAGIFVLAALVYGLRDIWDVIQKIWKTNSLPDRNDSDKSLSPEDI